jgi:antirestriction protein ArdC
MKIAQLYADVTVNIIKELEAGAVPWLKCWKESSDGLLPANAVTERSYSGINIRILWLGEIARVRFVSLSPPNKRSLCRGATSIGGRP